MSEIDFMSAAHNNTKRDYLKRVNDLEYPKHVAAELAKKFDYDYWDGDRRICYGGYKYIPGRWESIAKKMVEYYDLPQSPKILDIGCGKGYLVHDFKQILPQSEVYGIDISEYAIKNSKEEIKDRLTLGDASNLPFETDYFDLVISINTLHCLEAQNLYKALKEMKRVGRLYKYLCVESYRNELEKANLLYWQVSCEAFNNPEEWQWWFTLTGYDGDYSFIYFE